jgi:hypothetical protein
MYHKSKYVIWFVLRILLSIATIVILLFVLYLFLVPLVNGMSNDWVAFSSNIAYKAIHANESIEAIPLSSLDGFPLAFFTLMPLLIALLVFVFVVISLKIKMKHAVTITLIILFVFEAIVGVATLDYYLNFKRNVSREYSSLCMNEAHEEHTVEIDSEDFTELIEDYYETKESS